MSQFCKKKMGGRIYFSRTDWNVHLHVLSSYILKDCLSTERQYCFIVSFLLWSCCCVVTLQCFQIYAENKLTQAHKLFVCLHLSQFSKCQGVAVHHSFFSSFLLHCFLSLCWGTWQCWEREQMQDTAWQEDVFIYVQTGWQVNKRSVRVRVHLCVSVIKGLPYEGTLCGSRNTQQDLSMLSEAHRYRLRKTQKTETGDGGRRERRAEEELDMTVSLNPRRNTHRKYRQMERHVEWRVVFSQIHILLWAIL